jgi:signal transduction histidine kinase
MSTKSAETSKSRILIVEDDPAIIELMKAQLHGEGYFVDSVRDGDLALKRVEETLPDLVLLDIMLPKKSGFEVCKRIRAGQATANIPVIMVTALKDMESRVKGIAVGADEFLTRPVDKAELVARVKSLLRITRLSRELADEAQTVQESDQKIEIQQRALKLMSTQLMQASHLKYEFIVDMSHSLRTPLNVIIGFSEMLQDELVGDLNEKQTKYVRNIRNSGRELQQLIANIVEIFKIDAGKVPLETTQFKLKDVVDTAIEAYKVEAKARGIRANVKISAEVSRISADPQKLSTILDNLLSNAFKHTPSGGSVEVSAERCGDEVSICVADSGAGLSPEECERVFSEFHKVSDPAVSCAGGSGLGLAIAKKLAMMHGGNIRAECEKGSGARFILTLPLKGEQLK